MTKPAPAFAGGAEKFFHLRGLIVAHLKITRFTAPSSSYSVARATGPSHLSSSGFQVRFSVSRHRCIFYQRRIVDLHFEKFAVAAGSASLRANNGLVDLLDATA